MHEDEATRADLLEDLAHPRSLAEQMMIGIPLPQTLPQRSDFVLELPVVQRLVHQDFETDRIDRLEQIIVRAELHRGDGRINRRMPGHHNRRDRQVAAPDLGDQVQPGDAGQTKVGQDHREIPLDQPFQRGRAVMGNLDDAVRLSEQLRQLLTDQFAVVHHKDASIHGALIQG